jgi:hypothetical protein
MAVRSALVVHSSSPLIICQGEIKSLIEMDLDFLRSYAQVQPDPWGTSQPHNAYKETPAALRPIIGHQTRLESGQIVQQSVFHDSIKYSPQQLTSSDYMITMSIIWQSFGSGFVPQYPPLNEFEQYCKDDWGKGVRHFCVQSVLIVEPSIPVNTLPWHRKPWCCYPANRSLGNACSFGSCTTFLIQLLPVADR